MHAHMHTYTSIHIPVHAHTLPHAHAHMHKLTHACRMGRDKLQTPLAWPPEGQVKVWPDPGTFLVCQLSTPPTAMLGWGQGGCTEERVVPSSWPIVVLSRGRLASLHTELGPSCRAETGHPWGSLLPCSPPCHPQGSGSLPSCTCHFRPLLQSGPEGPVSFCLGT